MHTLQSADMLMEAVADREVTYAPPCQLSETGVYERRLIQMCRPPTQWFFQNTAHSGCRTILQVVKDYWMQQ